MIKYFYKTILVSLLVSSVQTAFSQQSDSAELISIEIHLIGEGTPRFVKKNDNYPYYFLMATIKNTQDTAIHFYVMTCSWPGDNWRSSNDSIFCWYPGCDSNIPDRIELLPHQSISFNVLLSYKKSITNRSLKLGFIYFNTWSQIWDAPLKRKLDKTIKTYWSKEFTLADKLLEYQID